MKKKGNTGVWVFLILVIVLVLFVVGAYNNLVTRDMNVENSWAKVQTAYERRADLIPNLVETVKGYSKYEGDVQKSIAQYRSGIKDAQNPNDLDSVGNEMNSLISNLIVSFEAYPELKANQNYLALMDELAGTENRIKWERDNYNEAVKSYKLSVRKFPSNIIANLFNFELEKYNMFEAEEGSENPIEVSFD
jgi:LemA protein